MLKDKINSRVIGLCVGLGTLALVGGSLSPANASTAVEAPDVASLSGVLDPSTFEGPVLIATPEGEVLTAVEAGELEAEAAAIRSDVQAGSLAPDRDLAEGKAGALSDDMVLNADGDWVTIMGTCSTWQNAIASPFSYALSGTGCAVFGYEGYKRSYAWRNNSDVSLCVQALGFVNSSQQFYSLGCSPTNGVSINWGNVLAYTQVKALSLSGATGAAYSWWD